jgi:tetratricopeptide (TPR) repeat protein
MFRVPGLSLALLLISAAGSAQSTVNQPAPATGTVTSSVPSATVAPLPGPTDSLAEAKVLYRKGNFDGAIAKYQEFLKDHPNSPDAIAGEVHVYLKQKNVEQAAQTVEQGLAQSDSPRLRVAQAEVWFRQGKINEAEKQWVEIIKSGNAEARAYLGLARVRNAIAMYKTARKMIDKAHELDLSDPDIQQEWIGTLPRSERIKYLETSLAGENNRDAGQRAETASYLQYLTERAKQKHESCHLLSKVTRTETPLVRLKRDPEHLRGYGLSVVLNGHKELLMLDTGASGILVKQSIAEHAGISKISETRVWGIGNKGRRNAYLGVADSIQIGELEFQNCPVEVMESRSVAEEDGLIGADVFEDFLVDIDFPHEKLRLGELPKRPGETGQKLALKSDDDDSDDANSPVDNAKSGDAKTAAQAVPSSGPQDRHIAPEMQSYTHVYRFGHDLLIPTTIGKVPSKLFLLDTGAFNNSISPAAAREVTRVRSNENMIVKGISGQVDNVYSADKTVLQFGNLRQENQEMTAFDTKPISDGIGTEVSGFLGFVLLRFLDIKIDYRDSLVDFQYDPKHWQ